MPRKVGYPRNESWYYLLLTRIALADILETLKKGDKQVPIEVIRRTKDVEENVNLYKPIIDELDGVSVMQKIYTRSFWRYSCDLLS